MRSLWKQLLRRQPRFGLLLHATNLVVTIDDDPAGPTGSGGAYAWRLQPAASEGEAVDAAKRNFERELRATSDVQNDPDEPITIEVDQIRRVDRRTEFRETALVFYVGTDDVQ